MKSFTAVFLILFTFSPFAYAYVSIVQTDKRTDYPGKEEAQKVKLFWDNNTLASGELSFVKGNEWFAGNLSYHLPGRPKWIYDSNNIFLCNKNLDCIKYRWLIMNISDKWKKILFVIVIVAAIEFSGFGIIASLLRLISSAS